MNHHSIIIQSPLTIIKSPSNHHQITIQSSFNHHSIRWKSHHEVRWKSRHEIPPHLWGRCWAVPRWDGPRSPTDPASLRPRRRPSKVMDDKIRGWKHTWLSKLCYFILSTWWPRFQPMLVCFTYKPITWYCTVITCYNSICLDINSLNFNGFCHWQLTISYTTEKTQEIKNQNNYSNTNCSFNPTNHPFRMNQTTINSWRHQPEYDKHDTIFWASYIICWQIQGCISMACMVLWKHFLLLISFQVGNNYDHISQLD